MKTSEVLNRAADLIEERGWTQGPDGWGLSITSGLCLEGGIAAAMGTGILERESTLYTCPAYAATAAYLDRVPMPPAAPIKDALWQWNDNTETTAELVVKTLRACALIEAAKECEVVVVTAREGVAV